jgi:hypothetical protein
MLLSSCPLCYMRTHGRIDVATLRSKRSFATVRFDRSKATEFIPAADRTALLALLSGTALECGPSVRVIGNLCEESDRSVIHSPVDAPRRSSAGERHK